MRRFIAALLILIPVLGYSQSAKYILDSNDVVTPEFMTASNTSVLAVGLNPFLTNFITTNYFNPYISGFLASTNALQARTNLGLSLSALTNTNAANFNTALGLGTNSAVTFQSLSLSGTSSQLNLGGGNTVLSTVSATGQFTISITGGVRLTIPYSDTTNVGLALGAGGYGFSSGNTSGAAMTRTNLGIPWSGLTNTNASTFQIALFNSSSLNAQGQRITNLASPVNSNDAVTMSYVMGLFTRVAPSVSFGNTVGTVEIGSTVTNVPLSWSISPTNTPVSSQSISPTIGSMATTLRATNATGTFTSDTTWTLTVNDGTGLPGAVVVAQTSIAFRHYMSWGIASTTNLDNSQIRNLHTNTPAGAGREFRDGRGKSVNISGNGQYIYFAYPSSFGAASFIVNNAPNTAWISNTVTYTNASSNTTQFLIYRSTDPQFGTSIPITLN